MKCEYKDMVLTGTVNEIVSFLNTYKDGVVNEDEFWVNISLIPQCIEGDIPEKLSNLVEIKRFLDNNKY